MSVKTKDANGHQELTPELARQLLAENEQVRAAACQAEIAAALERHNCRLEAVFVLRGGQLPAGQVQIVANP